MGATATNTGLWRARLAQLESARLVAPRATMNLTSLNSVALRRWLAGSVTLGVLCVAPGLAAQVEFAVPPECGDRTLFATEIQKRLGAEKAAALLDVLELRISAKSSGYSLVMRIAKETRQLEDPNCSDLFRAAVVVAVALWEEPQVTTTAPVSTPAAMPASPAPALPSISESSVVQAQSAPPTWILAGEIGGNWGLRPKLGPVFGLRGALDVSGYGAIVTLRLLPPNASRDANQRGVEVFGLGGGVGGYVTLYQVLRLELGVSVYYLSGLGLGSRTVSGADLTSIGPHIGLRVTPWTSGGAYVALGAEGHVELLPLRFQILEYGEVFRIPWCTVTGVLEVGYRFR